MDNEAFRALVRERAKGRSTKEIAREAVEAEFKLGNKKRGRDDDYFSGSDDERSKHKKGGGPRGQDRADSTEQSNDKDPSSNYRDRAKERREGKIDPNTMTKELDMFTSGSTPTPIVARKAPTKKKEHLLVADAMPTLDEGKERLHKFAREPSSQQIVSSGLSGFIRLLSNRLSTSAHRPSQSSSHSSATAKAIQRSRLIMSADGNANDYRKAWEIPREVAHPNPNFDKYFRPRLDLEVVNRIEKVVSTKKRLGVQSIKVESRADKVSPYDANSNSSDEDEDIFGGMGV
jgi:hypothetical protein